MVFKSKLPDADIPLTSLSAFLLERAAQWDPKKPAFVDGPTGRTITFGQLPQLVKKVAAGLTNLGIRQHDVVLLLAPNLPEWPIVFLAVASLGAAVTTCNPLYTTPEIVKQAQDSGPRLIITIAAFLDKLDAPELFPKLPVIIIGKEAPPGTTSLTSLLENQSFPEPPEVTIDPHDVVALPYSSGTTGVAKGVMLTHKNLIANVCQIFLGPIPAFQVKDGEVFLGLLPFFHIYGLLVLVLQPIATGATLVIMPRFELTDFLETIQKFKVTFVNVVPPIVLALAKHPLIDKYNLSSLRGIMSGAAPIGSDLLEAVSKRLNILVAQGYGMTESSPITLTTHDVCGKPRPPKLGSAGSVCPNTEAKIVDPVTGQELGTNQRGELMIRGPQVMKGYLNNPEATAATVDFEGWLHTGDVAYADEDEDFFVVDRVKELIKFKGFQVPPAELEALLVSHKEITDAAVVGLPDIEAGELPVAFVVRAAGASTTGEEVMEFVKKQVASYKQIRQVHFVEAIPKSLSGKILRKDLKAQLLVQSPL